LVGDPAQQDVAGAALDQCGDGRAATGADEQIAFPVPGYRPVGDLGGTLRDHHRVGEPATALNAALASA
jgi:hypothetical protein